MSISVILTRNAKIKRIILGSLIGGVSTILLFISLNSMISFLVKIIIGVLMVLTTFGFHDIRYTFNNLFYLYTLSFSLGGVMYLLMDRGIYNYFILIIGFILVTFLYVKQIKRFKNNYAEYYHVQIYYQGKILQLTGFLDTGNKLYDNYQHRPIILIDQKIKYHLEDIIYVPYTSLNNTGVLRCLKTDKIIVNHHVFHNYLIGLSNKKIQIDGINCLLHSKMKGELHA